MLDDFIPAGQPGSSEHGAARHHWLSHPLLKAAEIRLTPSLATLAAVSERPSATDLWCRDRQGLSVTLIAVFTLWWL
ncbi:hypothetical protein I6A60_25640 [Frankia sp. AgB1.9]|uniref:hypothetical protein n=1 Tax=unclassified Frankia TaxID=2632575 RepID=UPI001934392B|nr:MULTISPECIES: hypothetical protein [unclassified Frankia]MBL7492873.1 hypothetical protein [Frankia sp. AgW1.1]MBL7551222.1 hypothetical protein [Frankia sp. AgB1.9]MBL7622758.1 hypothetical protein [Frankia sp. AgB1.8]